MKTLLPFCLTIALLAACNVESNTSTENNTQDSIVEDRKNKMLAELKNKYSHEEQSTIYGELKFGMSEREYDKLIPKYSNELGGVSFLFKPSYNDEGKIQSLSIEGSSVTANYIDTKIEDEIKTLYSIIQSRYGDPNISFGKVNFFDLKPGYRFWEYGWTIGDKNIRIGKGEEKSGSTYYSSLYIYSQQMIEKSKDISKNEEKDVIKSDSNKF